MNPFFFVPRVLVATSICLLSFACDHLDEVDTSTSKEKQNWVYECLMASGVPIRLTQERCIKVGGRIISSERYHPLAKISNEFLCGVALTTDFKWKDRSDWVIREVERRQFSLADCRRIVGYQGQ